MISYPQFDFASPPRTGTAWFVDACFRSGLGERSRGSVHIPHEKQRKTFCVTQVRHPCSWLASYWTTIFPGHVGVDCVDAFRFLRGGTFDQFVTSYLKKIPGGIGRMFAQYDADNYLRLEDQPGAFLELMESVGIRVRWKTIMPYGIMNKTLKVKPRWHGAMWQAVMKSEQEMVEKFGYGKP